MKNAYRFTLSVRLLNEGDYIVAYCPALELSSYGKNERDARKRFEEALNIFIEETERKGTLEKELLMLGWTLRLKPKMMAQPTYPVPSRAVAAKMIKEFPFQARFPLAMA